jgi:hypothetical protein
MLWILVSKRQPKGVKAIPQNICSRAIFG